MAHAPISRNNKENAEMNRCIVLNLVRLRQPIFRSDIVKITGLSHASVGNIINDLIRDGWVEEQKASPSGLGRAPRQLRFCPSVGYAVGIDIGAENVRMVVTDFAGGVAAEYARKTTDDRSSGDTLVVEVITAINEILDRSPVPVASIKGIGVGVSGIMDHVKGVCLSWPTISAWKDVCIKDAVEERFGMLAIVDDSTRMMALGERRLGVAVGVEDFLYINLGMGVGAALFIDGSVYRGSGGIAGEFGHMTVDERGPRCHCGNYGCLESLVSGAAIADRARAALSDGVTSSLSDLASGGTASDGPAVQAIAESARAGDKLAFSLFNKTGEYLGIAIANVVNLLNPALVVVGGGLSGAWDLLVGPVTTTVKMRALPRSAQDVRLEVGGLGPRAGAVGAAVAIIDSALSMSEAGI